jgi:hypothetical protein
VSWPISGQSLAAPDRLLNTLAVDGAPHPGLRLPAQSLAAQLRRGDVEIEQDEA